MNINEITDMYYNAVVNLEKYLKTQKENIDELHFESNDNKKQLYKVIHYWWYDTFCNSLKPYMSWKSCEKMNYECLGNGDTHLHWHLFPRVKGDLGDYGNDGKGPVWWLPQEIMWNDDNIPNNDELEKMKTKLLKELDKYETSI